MATISVSKVIVVAFFLCAIAGCSRSGDSQAQLPSQNGHPSAKPAYSINDKDTYAVYDALLDSPSTGAAKGVNNAIAIMDHTRTVTSCSDLVTAIDPKLKAARQDFNNQNSLEWALKPDSFNFSRKVKVISSTKLDAIFADGVLQGWSKFHNIYPDINGYIELSAVGFSADKDFAVVYSAVHCGPKCGTGAIVTLSKNNGVWRKNSNRLCSWIS